MSIFGAIFRPPEIQVAFDGADARPHKDVTLEQKGTTEKLPIYGGSEAVTGTVTINTKSKIEHIGIKVELIGQIEFFHDDHPYEFISLVRELEAPGVLAGSRSYPFDFSGADKPEESYNGYYARLRYSVRVTISRQMVSRRYISRRAAPASARAAPRRARARARARAALPNPSAGSHRQPPPPCATATARRRHRHRAPSPPPPPPGRVRSRRVPTAACRPPALSLFLSRFPWPWRTLLRASARRAAAPRGRLRAPPAPGGRQANPAAA